ncbi:hypothetical protein GCM10007919_50410 [Rhizobium indigoferae]|nr:hypothetical protein GCM10007919_50410 [Rhizobium indigoferae]
MNAAEQPNLRKKLSRREMVKFFESAPQTTIALEACGGSHHWARLLSSFGHEVKWHRNVNRAAIKMWDLAV